MNTLLDGSNPHSPDVDEHDLDVRIRRVAHRVVQDSLYAFSAFPIALLAFVLSVVVLSLGLGLAVVVGGVLLVAVAVQIARYFATLERQRLRTLQGHAVPHPGYRRASPADRFWLRALTPVSDPQSWRDVAWSVLGVLTATAASVLTLTWWAAAGGGLTYWLWQLLLPAQSDTRTLASALVGEGRVQESVVNFLIGALALVTLPFVARFAASMHATLATALLVGVPLGNPNNEAS